MLLRAHPGHGRVYFCFKRSGCTPLAHQHKHIITHTTQNHKRVMIITMSTINKERIIDIAAWIGTAAILTGYGLFSTGLVPDPFLYHVLNMLGSLAVGYISYRRKVWQPVVINAVFALLAAIAIIRTILH